MISGNQSPTCPHCGFRNAAGAAFCGKCGRTLAGPATPDNIFCPYCESPNAPGAVFCGNCGREMDVSAPAPMPHPRPASPSVYCPHCEAENPPGAVFCGNCGREMGAPAPPNRLIWWLLGLLGLALVCATSLILLAGSDNPVGGMISGLFAAGRAATPDDLAAGADNVAPPDIGATPTTTPTSTPTATPTPTATDIATPTALPTLTPLPTPTPQPTPPPPAAVSIPGEIVFHV